MSSERTAPGSAVLAEALDINCMKFTPSRQPVRRSLNDGRSEVLFSYSVREGRILIVAALAEGNRPQSILNESSLDFNVGDSINGMHLCGFSDSMPGKARVGTSATRSARHSRQSVSVKGAFSYAVIVSSWSGENIDPHPLEQSKRLTELK